MFKGAKVKMLPTTSISENFVQPYTNPPGVGNSPTHREGLANPSCPTYLKQLIREKRDIQLFHLYVITNEPEELSIGDYCIELESPNPRYSNLRKILEPGLVGYKVLATTENIQDLPKISEKFISRYGEHYTGIEKVAIEYDENGPIVNYKKNTIAIRNSSNLEKMEVGRFYVILESSAWIPKGAICQCIRIISHEHSHYDVTTESGSRTNIVSKFRPLEIEDLWDTVQNGDCVMVKSLM